MYVNTAICFWPLQFATLFTTEAKQYLGTMNSEEKVSGGGGGSEVGGGGLRRRWR